MPFAFTVRTKDDLIRAILEYGFVPLFRNAIPGFSIEEHVAPEAWFDSGIDGVWEWKGPVIRESGCAYGKFLEHKAAFISAEWFPDFANYRRDGYDFDARYEEGLAPYADKTLFDLVEANAPAQSGWLKRLGGYGKDGRKGFDASMARLQAQCYVITSDFIYQTDRYGRRYGWGTAEYTTPEARFGPEFRRAAYSREPAESYTRVLAHLQKLLPEASEKQLRRILA